MQDGLKEEKLRCAKAEIDYHLGKPVHPSELLHLLSSVHSSLVKH